MRRRLLNRTMTVALARRNPTAEPPAPVVETPAALVRTEIRRSAGLTARLRWVAASAGILAGPGLMIVLLLRLGVGLSVAEDVLIGASILAALGLGVGLGVGVPTSLALLHERRQRARQRLAELPHEQRLEVLLSLRNERGDTRRIVAPLLRELGVPKEITPSGGGDGRGDELGPA
jgi:hypothetical protein